MIHNEGGRYYRSSTSDNGDGEKPSLSDKTLPPPRFVGGWDDEDDLDYATAIRNKREQSNARRGDRKNYNQPRRTTSNNSYSNFQNTNNHNYGARGGRNQSSYAPQHQQHHDDTNRINMKLLEQEAGFDHLYGIAPVLNALRTARRDLYTSYERSIDDTATLLPSGESLRPEAQTRPCLFVQEQESSSSSTSSRTAVKAEAVAKAIQLAENMRLSIAHVDKGILNTLSNNRPHQGLVLRCGKLTFEKFLSFQHIGSPTSLPSFWLVLDQVVDPQNFGALIRTAEFLQVRSILICGKHSAPASAVVSAASAGALEGNAVKIYTTSSLPRTLANAKESGATIIGAASSVPIDFDAQLFDLDDLQPDFLLLNHNNNDIAYHDRHDLPKPPQKDQHSILLVLGSEGHGLRYSVAKSCTHFCRIPGSSEGTVDSLNVSVAGGIFLYHFMRNLKQINHKTKDNKR